MHRPRLLSAALAAAALTAAPLAFAVVPPGGLAAEDRLITIDGPARAERTASWQPPPAQAVAWAAFLRDHGPDWRARWDVDTGVAHRILGVGLPVPGATDDDVRAAAAARAVIAEALALLAPGARADELVLAGTDLTDGLRSVGFVQTHRGMRVLGGQVSVRIKRDRVIVLASTALPRVDAPVVAQPIAADVARAAALAYLADAGAGRLTAGAVGAPVVLPIVRDRAPLRYATVVTVTVDGAAPIGRWDVFVDAATGAPIARRQTLAFGAGTLAYEAPARWYGGERRAFPAFAANVSVAGAPATTHATTGALGFTGASASVTARATGPIVAVANQAGAAASFTGTLADGQTLTWRARDQELVEAQLAVFVHGALVKQWAKTVSSIGWLDQTLPAQVNIADTCNAYSDGTRIHFFRAGGGCGNTALIADVIYHEFGHSFHNHAIIDGVGAWDGALSEGLGDFVSATITGDPAMGPGFFGDGDPLRHCDPAGTEQVWPRDVGAIHHTGKIYCGAMWDLRKLFLARLGETAGRARVDKLFYESFRRADDIPSTYVELLAFDDDDGDLANGTPHQCEIDDAYARHGLAEATGPIGPRAQAPSVVGRAVTVRLQSSGACAGANVGSGRLVWRLAGEAGVGGELPMTLAGDTLTGELPSAPWGAVLEWQLALTTGDGTGLAFPDNAADPWYQTFVGEGTTIVCTDFEADPAAAGWTHALVSGAAQQGADDWQWGAPLGEGGDPTTAASGTRVMGNDLGAGDWNGEYQPDKVNRLTSPVFDTAGYDVVRLQYRRWLGVEDGVSDRAEILAGTTAVWRNLAADTTHHVDREWRLHDVDLTAVAGGPLQLTWQLTTDPGLQLGGWTLDDVCLVGFHRPTCGNAVVEAGEACDDGNTDERDDCRSDCTAGTPIRCGDGAVDLGEECDDGNATEGDGCSAACLDERGPPGEEPAGCGCRTSGRAPAAPVAAAFALVLGFALRRRPRAARR